MSKTQKDYFLGLRKEKQIVVVDLLRNFSMEQMKLIREDAIFTFAFAHRHHPTFFPDGKDEHGQWRDVVSHSVSSLAGLAIEIAVIYRPMHSEREPWADQVAEKWMKESKDGDEQ